MTAPDPDDDWRALYALEREALEARLRRRAAPPGGPPPVAPRAAGARGARARLGGRPLLPEGFAWPRDDAGRALSFYGQIAFDELAHLDLERALPAAGTLSLFARVSGVPEPDCRWLERADPDDACHALAWFPPALPLRERAPPDGLPEGAAGLPLRPLDFEPAWDLAWYGAHDRAAIEACADPGDKVLGAPRGVWGRSDEIVDAWAERWDARSGGAPREMLERLREGPDVLLLQLDVRGGDHRGVVALGIRADDLRARRFGRAVLAFVYA